MNTLQKFTETIESNGINEDIKAIANNMGYIIVTIEEYTASMCGYIYDEVPIFDGMELYFNDKWEAIQTDCICDSCLRITNQNLTKSFQSKRYMTLHNVNELWYIETDIPHCRFDNGLVIDTGEMQ